MKWQPIETAPVGVRVEMGTHEKGYNEGNSTVWNTSVGVAKESWRWLWWQYTFRGSIATHWRHLPDPPE